MKFSATEAVTSLLALAHGALALPQAAQTVTVTSTVTSAPASCATLWHKTYGPGSYYSQHVCADKQQSRCLVGTKLSTQSNSYSSWYMYYGEWRSAWDGQNFHAPDPLNGGPLIISYSTQNGTQTQCYFESVQNNTFNCFNANGAQYLWWYNNTDMSVGLGLSIPAGTTQFQAYYMGY